MVMQSSPLLTILLTVLGVASILTASASLLSPLLARQGCPGSPWSYRFDEGVADFGFPLLVISLNGSWRNGQAQRAVRTCCTLHNDWDFHVRKTLPARFAAAGHLRERFCFIGPED